MHFCYTRKYSEEKCREENILGTVRIVAQCGD